MSAVSDLGSWVGLQPKREPTFLESLNSTLSLSFHKRIVVFITLFGLGVLFCILSTYFLMFPRKFAKFYTAGSILMLLSTFFLTGPVKQLQSMFSKDRALPSLVYIGAIGGTLYAALTLQSSSLTIVMIFIQFAAAVVYALSYIPLGNTLVFGAARSVLPI